MKKFLAILAITIISATAAFAQVDSLPAAAAPQPVSNEPEALWAAANAAYNGGEWDKALTSYNIIAEKELESAPLYYNMANAYFQKGDIAHAILYYNRALRLAPAD